MTSLGEIAIAGSAGGQKRRGSAECHSLPEARVKLKCEISTVDSDTKHEDKPALTGHPMADEEVGVGAAKSPASSIAGSLSARVDARAPATQPEPASTTPALKAAEPTARTLPPIVVEGTTRTIQAVISPSPTSHALLARLTSPPLWHQFSPTTAPIKSPGLASHWGLPTPATPGIPLPSILPLQLSQNLQAWPGMPATAQTPPRLPPNMGIDTPDSAPRSNTAPAPTKAARPHSDDAKPDVKADTNDSQEFESLLKRAIEPAELHDSRDQNPFAAPLCPEAIKTSSGIGPEEPNMQLDKADEVQSSKGQPGPFRTPQPGSTSGNNNDDGESKGAGASTSASLTEAARPDEPNAAASQTTHALENSGDTSAMFANSAMQQLIHAAELAESQNAIAISVELTRQLSESLSSPRNVAGYSIGASGTSMHTLNPFNQLSWQLNQSLPSPSSSQPLGSSEGAHALMDLSVSRQLSSSLGAIAHQLQNQSASMMPADSNAANPRLPYTSDATRQVEAPALQRSQYVHGVHARQQVAPYATINDAQYMNVHAMNSQSGFAHAPVYLVHGPSHGSYVQLPAHIGNQAGMQFATSSGVWANTMHLMPECLQGSSRQREESLDRMQQQIDSMPYAERRNYMLPQSLTPIAPFGMPSTPRRLPISVSPPARSRAPGRARKRARKVKGAE